MNTITAACGHVVVAVGAPGSERRAECERSCDQCRCQACQGTGQDPYMIRQLSGSWGLVAINRPCEHCNGKGWVRL